MQGLETPEIPGYALQTAQNLVAGWQNSVR
jgi:hypothetical protein